MTSLDLTLPTPEENLACDEVLLDTCEDGGGEGWLRFWEPQTRFVVVGYGNPVATEVNLDACREHGVPVFRRCSGGGTVLQGPGCLNYALILPIESPGPLQTITSANHFIMERNQSAIESTSGTKAGTILTRGCTDLVIGDRKFSGNSQRRRKKFLLFHGTFLLQFDIPWIETLLRMPARQPDYRHRRAHGEFLTNLELPAPRVKQALCEAWSAVESPEIVPRETIACRARDKYATREWNFKF